jgi:AcrR family transcriptional regulator
MPRETPAETSVKGSAQRKSGLSPQRDRDRTRRKILDALGVLLSRDGFKNAGINAVAREAGVDKVLVYRYFGGLDGLFAAFAKEFRFFPSAEDVQPGGDTATRTDPLVLGKHFLLGVGRALRQSPTAREILRWELLERNALTDLLATQRERRAVETLSLFRSAEDIDLPAIASVIAAGQTYLVLHATVADVYNGVDLRTDEGWARIERAINLMIDCLDARYHLLAGQRMQETAEGTMAHTSTGESLVPGRRVSKKRIADGSKAGRR